MYRKISLVPSTMSATRPAIRSRILPRKAEDWGLFAATLLLVPAVYIYEMCIVLPFLFSQNSCMYYFVIFGGIFIFTNIVSNFVGLVVIDTSIPREVMPQEKPGSGWEFCFDCNCYVPPRAWHCKHCRMCILKRDHHCMFSGSCVGHYNLRYFLMFLISLNIATLYCILSDTVFLFQRIEMSSFACVLKFAFPLCAIAMGIETIENEMCILSYLIVIATFCFTSFLLNFHVKIMLNGQVTHDVTSNCTDYNLGKIQNIKEVLGKNCHLSWIFPLIPSELPHDGIKWDTNTEWKLRHNMNSVKHR